MSVARNLSEYVGGLSTTLSADHKQLTIRVGRRFDFNVHAAFRKSFKQVPGPGTTFYIDLSDTEYIDSSALGMLLILRDYAGGDKARITIRGASPELRGLLTVANFEEVFTID